MFRCGSGANDTDVHDDVNEDDEYEKNIEGNAFVAVSINDSTADYKN